MGVLQLQQLNQPLDVGEAAAAEFDVPRRIRAAGQPLPLHASLDPPDLPHLRFPGWTAVPHLVDQFQEVGAQLIGAGDRPCPQQRLALPGGHPALVVLAVGVQRAGQRALLAFGAQVGVDLQRELSAHRRLHRLRQQLSQAQRELLSLRVSLRLHRPG